VVHGFEAGVSVRGRKSDSGRFANSKTDGSPILIGRFSEVSWSGTPEREGFLSRVGHGLRVVLRLIVPVVLLLAVLSASFMYAGIKIPQLAVAPWLTLGHALIMLSFFTVMLTNRRYGPAYALAQVVIAISVIGSVTVASAADVATLVPQVAAVPERIAIAFSCAFFAANFAAIVSFDAARGPRWWTAPLMGSFFAALIFTMVFYPAAFLGQQAEWLNHMAVHGGVMFAAGVALLLPYWMLRRAVPPLPGYNGY
jgi:uncharacterized PurR-regulated membrane protein YhhQ (DUF165 family)